MLSYSFGPNLERPSSRAAPIARKFASRLRAPKVDCLRPVSNLNSLTFFKSPQTSARFRCVTSLALRHPFCIGVLWHLNDTTIRPCAPALTPASMLHPTNPRAESKGPQPNHNQRHEPNSLGYYITSVFYSPNCSFDGKDCFDWLIWFCLIPDLVSLNVLLEFIMRTWETPSKSSERGNRNVSLKLLYSYSSWLLSST